MMPHAQRQRRIAHTLSLTFKSLRYASVAVVFAMLASCSDMLVGKSPERTPEALYDQVWQDFDRYYSFFEISGVDWNAVDRRYRPQARAVKTNATLIPILRAMLTELHDPHVDLVTAPNQTYPTVNTREIITFFDLGVVLPRYVTNEQLTPSQRMRYGKLGTDLCYINISAFGGDGWANEIDGILNWCHNVRGVVLDVRDNLGGSSGNAEEIAGRFVDEKKIFAYVRYRNGPRHSDFTDYRPAEVKPVGSQRFVGGVAVLTNRKTLSAAEHFVLAMRGRPGAITVGDTTAGGMGSPLVRELPNGWMYRVPQWIEYDADRVNYERKGIPPKLVVKYDAAAYNARRDPQLEAAMQRLRQ